MSTLMLFRDAAARTRETLQRPVWWIRMLLLDIAIIAFAAALPVFLLLKLGLIRQFTYEASPFEQNSLMRLLVPTFGLAIAVVACGIVAQFVIEMMRVSRDRS